MRAALTLAAVGIRLACFFALAGRAGQRHRPLVVAREAFDGFPAPRDAAGGGGGYVVGVAGHAVTHHFAKDRGATGLGMLEGFKHQHTGTFADHKAIAFLVEGTAGGGRIIVAERQGLGAGEAGHSQGGNR